MKPFMKGLCLLSNFWFFFLPTSVFAQSSAVLGHSPIDSAFVARDIIIGAEINAPVIMAKLYFKPANQETYIEKNMQKEGDRLIARIEANLVQGDSLLYFLSILTQDQNVLTHPSKNPYNHPNTIYLKKASRSAKKILLNSDEPPAIPQDTLLDEDGDSPFLILSPEEGEILHPKDLVIAISVDRPEQIDSSAVQLILNGRNLTPLTERSKYLISVAPKSIKPGDYTLLVRGKTKSGRSLQPQTVAFTISEKNQDIPESSFSGRIESQMHHENIESQQESYFIGGTQFYGNYENWNYNGRLYLSSLEDSRYQPRNRFHLGIENRWVEFQAGDMYPYFNDLMLWGKRTRGIGGAINFGWFNLQVITGETFRSVEGSLETALVLDNNGMPYTTVSGDDSLYNRVRYGTFRQNLFAIRPSFGSGKKFQFGISFVKVKDDSTSIQFGKSPRENIVLGPDFKWVLDRGRLIFKASAALSLLTQDISQGPLSEKDIEKILGEDIDLPANPQSFADLMIINDSTIPIDLTQGNSMAYNVGFVLNYWRNYLRMGYKSIGSQYVSLANTWIRSDIAGFYFNDRIRLFSNQLYLNFGLENYQDGFSREETIPGTDLRTFNYGISFYPLENWPNVNINLRTHYRDNNITTLSVDSLFFSAEIDTIDKRNNQLHRDLTISLGYKVLFLNAQHHLNVSFTTIDKTDKYKSTRLTPYSNELSSDVRFFSIRSQISQDLTTNLNYATNSNLTGNGISNFDYHVFGLGGEWRTWKQRLTTFAEYRYTDIHQKYLETSMEINRHLMRFGGIWTFGNSHHLSFDANIFRVHNPEESYSDSILRLGYEKIF
ncbi:hypothetical protein GF406_17710 [candidate division KSB1 bacterium]|nr:hypothetical protein [candidate division KSB1 bacterium]